MQAKIRFPKQRGGPAKPWLLVTLLVAGLLSASMNIYLMRHQQIVINYTSQPAAPAAPKAPPNTDSDVGVVHILNDGGMGVCTFADAICWTRT
jgi:hypothetical protein